MVASNTSVVPASPRACRVTITPEMAQRWLDSANAHNRPLAMAYCQRLARDIKEGRWLLTHEGIAFSPHGLLLDGQHRLKAITLAGVAVEMFVWFDVEPATRMAINSGRPRTLVDALNLSGTATELTHHHIATLRVLLGGLGQPPKLTAAEAATAFERHREAIEFALVYLPARAGRRGVSTSITRGVVARAYYSADLDRLAAFCTALTTGMAPHVDDTSAVVLFNWLISSSGLRLMDFEHYRKVERALAAFLRRERITVIRPVAGELFPLPEMK